MININELRIGNWALYPHSIHEPFQITEPRHIELAYLLKPIPLSPKILQACGFSFIDMMFENVSMRYWRNNWIVWHSPGEVYLWNEKEVQLTIKIEYLHQLQNFFALTGSELSVNLEKVKV